MVVSFNSDFTSHQWLGILFYFNYFFSIHLTFISLLHFFSWTRKILSPDKKRKKVGTVRKKSWKFTQATVSF